MKTKFIIIIFVVFINTIYSQWLWNSPYPTSNYLHSIDFVNQNTGWIAGEAGTILKTTNGGVNWVVQKTGTTRNLYSVDFVDLNTGYACGAFKLTIRTKDGGENWVISPDSAFVDYYSIRFLNGLTGFVAGSSGLKRTTDGGVSWVTIPDVPAWLLHVYFVNTNTGFVLGEAGVIYKTSNSGINWDTVFCPTNYDLYSAYFINENTGWVTGNLYPMTTPQSNVILKTTNGGVNWQLTGNYPKYGIEGLYFENALTGYGCGTFISNVDSLVAVVRKTTDGGYNWFTYNVFDLMVLNDIKNVNGVLWTAGDNLFKSTNSGENWTRETKGFSNGVMTLSVFPPSNTIYVGGVRGLFAKSTNGGTNWSEIRLNNSAYIDNMYFANQSTGWACDFGGVHKTTNGGINWSFADIPGEQLIKMFFINENTGWVTSYGPNSVFKTTNAGNNWFLLPNITANYAHGICFLNANTGYVGDVFGGIYKTTNGGNNWDLYNTMTNNWIADFEFFDENTGFAAGELHSIFKTTNAGTNWTQIYTEWFGSFYDIEFIRQGTAAPTVGYAVGSFLAIYRTSNGGNNWYPMLSPTNQRMYQVEFVNNYTGYIVGGNGTVLYTTNGGSTFIYNQSENIPDNFELLQNYPNPFNISTIIIFGLKKNTNVKMVLYDVTGKELETLVDGYFQSGTYKISSWLGDYSSGVYFYKLQAGEYTETKKMVLVK
jgi:photosystem II stability/assembly factor-like uncharacterized protein